MSRFNEDIESIHAYRLSMNKTHNAKFMSMNLERFDILNESINNSNLRSRNKICVFNRESYLNRIRIFESETLFLDEIEHQTIAFQKFKDFVQRQYDLISKDFEEQHIDIQPYDFDNNKMIAGNVMMFIVSPNDYDKATTIVKRFSEIALRFGYNYVCHDIDDIYSKNSYEIQIQFEATYFPGNVKTGDILWHVTTKNAAKKIIDQKKGLVPKSESKRGFSYSSRIYCFKVLNPALMKAYAQNSWKSNKLFIMSEEKQISIIKSEWNVLLKKEYGTVFDTKEFAILKVDTSKLKNVFFRDNTFEYKDEFVAVYTIDNIHYSAIEKMKDFTV